MYYLKKWFKRVVLVVLFCFAVAVGKWCWDLRQAKGRLAEAIAAAEASDPNWTYQALLDERPKLPPEQDGIALIMGVEKDRFDQLDEVPNPFEKLRAKWPNRKSNQQLPEEILDSISTKLSGFDDLVILSLQLKGMSGGYYETTLHENPFDEKVLHTSRILSLRSLINSLIYHEFCQGNIDSSIDYIESLLDLSRVALDDLQLIGKVIGCAMQRDAVESIIWMLGQKELDGKQIKRIDSILREDINREYFVNSTRHARAIVYRVNNAMFSGVLFDAESTDEDLRLSREERILFRIGQAKGYYGYAELMEVFNRVISDAKEVPESRLPHRIIDSKNHVDKVHIFAGMIRPAYLTYVNASVSTLAKSRSAKAAIACERYRIDNGQWPETLDELVPKYLPQVPSDPYSRDGKPLLYADFEGGVIIGSVGENGGELKVQLHQSEAIEDGLRLWDPDQRGLPASPKQEPRDRGFWD